MLVIFHTYRSRLVDKILSIPIDHLRRISHFVHLAVAESVLGDWHGFLLGKWALLGDQIDVLSCKL